MPDGRFLSRSIAQSEQLARVSLAADYLFTRCIPHLDRDGRMSGNPALVKAGCCPLRSEVGAGAVPDLLRQLAGEGLVHWYEVDGRQVLEFPGFRAHQKGMKYDREAPSRFPPRDSKGAKDLSRSRSGPTPDAGRTEGGEGPPKLSEVKLSEVKLSEVKGAPASRASDSALPALPQAGFDDDSRLAFEALCRASRNADGFTREIEGLTTGLTPPAYPWTVIGRALREMSANGDPPRVALLRAYCRRITTEKPPDDSTTPFQDAMQ